MSYRANNDVKALDMNSGATTGNIESNITRAPPISSAKASTALSVNAGTRIRLFAGAPSAAALCQPAPFFLVLAGHALRTAAIVNENKVPRS